MSGLSIVALGGNALIDPELPPTVPNQFAVTARVVVPVAELIGRGEHVVITHGNGPQVGFMALRSALSADKVHEVPLDSLVADTQGSLGYMIERALREELRQRDIEQPVVTLVTEVEVDPADPAFGHPSKPIGRFYSARQARHLESTRGWPMIEDSNRGWRRVVPSPEPKKVVNVEIVRFLLDAGVTVICCGGGGIPVERHEDGHITGIEAVIDKDLVSALLGANLGASNLFLTTSTDAVYLDYGTPRQRRIARLTISEVRALQAAGQFPTGSMGPKVEAAVQFLQGGGHKAVICSPDDLIAAFDGDAGTHIVND